MSTRVFEKAASRGRARSCITAKMYQSMNFALFNTAIFHVQQEELGTALIYLEMLREADPS